MAVSPDSATAADRVSVTTRLEALDDTFDAWAVVIGPKGGVYSITRRGGLRADLEPLARSVSGLEADGEVGFLEATVPPWLAAGDYTIAAALLPPGTVPGSLDDAASRAIDGYVDRDILTIN